MSNKEEDVEVLEGGDASSDVLDGGFTPDLVKKAKEAADADDTPAEDIESPDEWKAADEDEANLDWTGDDPKEEDTDEEDEEDDVVEEEEEDVAEEAKEGDEFEVEFDKTPEIGDKIDIDGIEYTVNELIDDKEAVIESSEEDKAILEVLKHLEGKTVIKVKGIERDIKDLTPEEIRVRIQKGDRFYQEMDSLADQRRQLDADRQKVNSDAEQVNRLMGQYSKPPQQQRQAQLPEGLRPHDDDTDNEKNLKGYIAQLATQVNDLQRGQVETRQTTESDAMLNEVDNLVEDYPLASREEVLAMKAVRPDIGTRELMEVSHNYYSSDKFIDKYFEVNPDKLREIQEKAQVKLAANKQKAGRKAVARKKAGSIVSSKTSDKKKKIPRNFDEIEALMPQIKRGYAESMKEE